MFSTVSASNVPSSATMWFKLPATDFPSPFDVQFPMRCGHHLGVGDLPADAGELGSDRASRLVLPHLDAGDAAAHPSARHPLHLHQLRLSAEQPRQPMAFPPLLNGRTAAHLAPLVQLTRH